MARPLQARYHERHPYAVERHDQEDGSITYEIWERELSTAKADAELIVRALNLMNGGLPD